MDPIITYNSECKIEYPEKIWLYYGLSIQIINYQFPDFHTLTKLSIHQIILVLILPILEM